MRLRVALFVGAAAAQLAYWLILRRGFARAEADDSVGASHVAIPGRDRRSGRTGRTADEPVGAVPGSPPEASFPDRYAEPSPGVAGARSLPFSVVVAARNEEARLPLLLSALARQTHQTFEVIIVDDGSRDRTASVAESFQNRIPSLRVIRRPARGKKDALTAGFHAAAHEVIALTDADCRPPPEWLSVLASRHTERGDVLVGYSPFRTTDAEVPTPLLRLLARYETFVTGFFTAAAIGLGRPYMAVGRNLSYPRTVFDALNGFQRIAHSLSGDDDLFVQDAARHGRIRVRAVLDARSFVPAEEPGSWRRWLHQKRRHVSAGRFYTPAAKAHLTAFHVTGTLTWMAPLALGRPGLGLLAVKLAVQGWVLRSAARRLGEEALMRRFLALEPAYVLYNLVVAPIGLAKMPERW